MTNNSFYTVSAADFYKDMKTVSGSENVRMGLATIAAEHNVAAEDSMRISKEIVDAVKQLNQCSIQVQEDTNEAMNKLFAELKNKSAETRIQIMDKMIFNIAVFSDENLLEQLENGKGLEELYNENCGKLPEANGENELILREKLMKQVESMSISPKAVRRMAKKAMKNNSYVSVAAEYARDSFNMKSTLAMEIYLENKDNMSVEEAVAIACGRITVEEAAKAVYSGQLTEKAASEIITYAGLAALIFLGLVLADAGVKTGGIIFASVIAVVMCFDGAQKIVSTAGQLGAQVSTGIRESVDAVAEGLGRIARFMDAEQADTEELDVEDVVEHEIQIEHEEFLDI